jgi:hypothetical protein
MTSYLLYGATPGMLGWFQNEKIPAGIGRRGFWKVVHREGLEPSTN